MPRTPPGYEVTKRVLITLNDVNRIDVFLRKVIEAGVNRVVDVSIENRELQKYREQVRTRAVTTYAPPAAYAKQLGQTVGTA